MASRGVNVVLVARRVPVLEASADDIRARWDVEVEALCLPGRVGGDDQDVELEPPVRSGRDATRGVVRSQANTSSQVPL